MADANDGRVTLWRHGAVYFDLREPPPDVEHHEYIARPVADDDAREERLKRAEEQLDALAQECSETEHVAREAGCDESIRHFPVALHDLLTRLTDERDEATRDRDEWKARAEKAEAALARKNAASAGRNEQTDEEVAAGNAADVADMRAMEKYRALLATERAAKGGVLAELLTPSFASAPGKWTPCKTPGCHMGWWGSEPFVCPIHKE